jgi:hypothetical protein
MAPKNISTPINPPEVSSIKHEENDEIHNKLSKLKEQLNYLNVRSITRGDFDKNMDENKNKIKE